MAHRSQRSSLGDNPLDPNYLPPHYREEYRLAIDALVERDLQGYCEFLQNAGMVEFLSRPELEHILGTVQAPRQNAQPELLYQEPEADGSSDTYWPVHSDLEAPVLDLGWPVHHSFIGPTEVTTLVNPSDPEMPSIKEQARRLIKRAQQVIAVAMDMFTDVDIFSDLLNAAARSVAVYILLDEQNAHHFCAMVSSCRVNLAMVKMMRVRTVSGTPYFCRTGKSFKGQMMGRFLLVDCRAVLSGNYSFMWSFEKIHRSIAHLFLGELVTTFDEEFRILYAQSEPLVMENALVPMPGGGSYCKKQFGSTRPSVSRNPREYLHTESPYFAELPGYPIEGHMDSEGRMLPFRRDEPNPGYPDHDPLQMHGNRYSSQQLNTERPFLEPDRATISRQMDINAHKRHSYAEGTQASSRQFMQHRIKHYPEEVDSLGGHSREQHYNYYHQSGAPDPGSGHAAYNKARAHGYHQVDQHEPGLQPESEPPGSYSHMLDYLSSDSSKEMRYRYGQKPAPAEGRYGRSSTKRPSLGQPYACQTSPTQPHPPDQKQPFSKSSVDHQPQDPGSKQGLRKWRINSYLSTLENSGEESMAEPLGPDAFDEPSHPFTEEQHDLETAPPGFSNRDSAQIPLSKPHFFPRYGKPVLPKASQGLVEDQPSVGTDSEAPAEAAAASGMVSNTEGDRAVEVEFRKPRDLIKQESFRTRPNISHLRSSRLRSSLIFSSSQVEHHFSVEAKPELDSSSENPVGEKDPLKTSSVLAEILEKRKFVPREPFDWSSLKQPKPTLSLKDSDVLEAPREGSSKTLEVSETTGVLLNEDMPREHAHEKQKGQVTSKDQRKTRMQMEPAKPSPGIAFNMDDPDSRLLYFKELAAKRKASKMAKESATEKTEPPVKTDDLAKAHSESSREVQVVSGSVGVSGNLERPKDPTNDQHTKQIKVPTEEETKLDMPKQPSKCNLPSVINMNDPESRFLYFKELAAQQKALKMAMESALEKPPFKNEDLSEASSKSSNTALVGSGPICVSGDVAITADVAHEHPKIKPEVQIEITPPEPPKASLTTDKSPTEKRELSAKTMNVSKAAPESSPDTFEVSEVCSVSSKKDPPHEQQKERSNTAEEEQTKLTVATEPPASSCTTKSLMNDPEGRALYLKDLAAKQSTIKTGMESIDKSSQPPVKITDDYEASSKSFHKTAEVTVTGVQPSVTQRPREIITDKPEEQCPVTQPEISSSSSELTEKLKERPSASQPEISPSPSKLTEKLEELPSATDTKISESPLRNNTEKLEGHLSAPQPKISQNPTEINVEKPVTSVAPIFKKSVVFQDSPEHDVRGSEITLERSDSGTWKQEAKSSCEPNPMAEEPPAPKSTPSALQEDTLRLPLPASISTHALPTDEELLKDATDAEKSEWIKSRGHKTSGVALGESGETTPLGSSPSSALAIVSRGKNETERPTGLPGPEGSGNTETVDKPATPEVAGQPSHEGGETSSAASTDAKKMARSKEKEADLSQLPPAASKTSSSRYQASTSNILHSSNLRDDTKVILERISANSQNRMEQAKQAVAVTDDAKEGDEEQAVDKAPENRVPGRGPSRFQQTAISTQEKESLLKRMESMRKEKKVYSRFELGS